MALSVGIPLEVKPDEHRVAITPDGVKELVSNGIDVYLESGAGANSYLSDEDYKSAGATVLASAKEVWSQSDLICKVKEPQPEEFEFLRENLVLFTYLHLAAYPAVAKALCEAKSCAIAYETVQRWDKKLPLLAPMSEVAGRLSVQVGAQFLEAHNGGRGILLGGIAGVRPGRVVIIGAGTVGWNAALIALGMKAEVHLLDRDLERLRYLDQTKDGRILTLASNRASIERALAEADLLIGAVLVPGHKAPVVVTEDMVKIMKPGSVLVDTAIDQGGCVETARETSHRDPVYEVHGVTHYAVGNMPSAVPITSTWALTNATMPYLLSLALHGVKEAARRDKDLALGVNIENGAFVNEAVAESFNAEPAEPSWA